MHEELDWDYGARSARVFGKIWGTMRDMGMADKIKNAKAIIRPALDASFKGSDAEFADAADDFTDIVIDYLEAIQASVAQLKIMELAVEDTLNFNFNEDRGNK
jgi:hypothetical protein